MDRIGWQFEPEYLDTIKKKFTKLVRKLLPQYSANSIVLNLIEICIVIKCMILWLLKKMIGLLIYSYFLQFDIFLICRTLGLKIFM